MARERVAVAEPAQRHQRAAQRTVHADRLLGVARAAGLEAAGRRPAGHERVHDEAPQVDGAEQQPERDRASCGAPAGAVGELAHFRLEPVEPLARPAPRPGRAGRRSRGRRRRPGPGSTRAAASRSSRLTRLRSTAPPTLRETVSPTRGSAAPDDGIAREGVDHEVPRRCRAAPPVDGLEVSRAREAPAARGGARHELRRQVLAAAPATALEDGTARARAHALAEAVRLCALALVGLIGALHVSSSGRRDGRGAV